MVAQLSYSGKYLEVEIDNEVTLSGVFRPRYYVVGEWTFFQEKSRLFSIASKFPKSFSYDREIILKPTTDQSQTIAFYSWKKPKIELTFNNTEYRLIFHKDFKVSIFIANTRAGYITVPPEAKIEGLKYFAEIDSQISSEDIQAILLVVFYKLEISDFTNSYSPNNIKKGFIGPLQEEITPFTF